MIYVYQLESWDDIGKDLNEFVEEEMGSEKG